MALDEDFDMKSECDKMLLATRFLATLKLDDIIEAVDRAHALAPLVDPTAYMNALRKGDMDRMRNLAKALQEPMKVYKDEIEPSLTSVEG